MSTLSGYSYYGWSGAQWTWTDSSGVLQNRGTLQQGSASGTADMCFTSGCYQFEVSGGRSPEEVLWSFASPDGATTGSGGYGGPWTVCEGDTITGEICR